MYTVASNLLTWM